MGNGNGEPRQGGNGRVYGAGRVSLGSRTEDCAGILCATLAKCTIIIAFV